jgi:hypothetical protein
MSGLQQQLQRKPRLIRRVLVAILRNPIHRPRMVAFHLHLGQLETSERVDFNHALGDAVVDKAAHRLAKIALGSRRFFDSMTCKAAECINPMRLSLCSTGRFLGLRAGLLCELC